MRIEVHFQDRVGIAQEILATLARRGLNLTAVEVDPPHIFIDAPGLTDQLWHELRHHLGGVQGVISVRPVDLLPMARRRAHLDALLDAMADPVVLVDAEGGVVVGNAAAAAVAGVEPAALSALTLASLFADPDLHRRLVAEGFRSPAREVVVGGAPFLLDCRPAGAGEAAGGVVTLRPPSRLGEQMHLLKHFRSGGFETILGGSPALVGLKTAAARMAGTDLPILILGETGTGKELVAHACHQASRRRGAPFLALNCAAVPENLAESELFGYAPGAFSGALKAGKPGLMEMASGGTVFLDEVGEMSPYLQSKLLRFLSDGRFRRVGGTREQSADVRIIAATHRPLDAMVAAQTFREDLFYRLNVLRLEVPALRARGEDILLLARHFIEEASAQVGRPVPMLAASARAALLAAPWPGNVRELQNVVFRAVALGQGNTLEAGDFDLAPAAPPPAAAAVPPSAPEPESWDEALAACERSLLLRLFPAYPSSRKLAARLKTSHTLIANKLRKHGLTVARGLRDVE